MMLESLSGILVLSILRTIVALNDPALSPDLFYPFGADVGDTVMAPNDDGTSGAVPIAIGFPFFGSNNTRLFVNTNGVITFGTSMSSYTPAPFPVATPMIAPYWCDIDTTRNKGRVYFRESNDVNLLKRATKDVRDNFSLRDFYSFKAVWIFVVTWHNVTYYGGGISTPINSFQTVLITDGRYSIAMFNYGWISWTTGTSGGGSALTGLGGTAAQVGFNSGDGVNFFAVPGSRQPTIVDIAHKTNAKLTGRWIFRVENSKMEASNTCEKKGKCEAYQILDDNTKRCTDIAPKFGCPVLVGPVVIERVWVEFYCDVPTEETRTNAAYHVTFLSNGEPIAFVPTLGIEATKRRATLHERHLQKLLDTWISCKVHSTWENSATEDKSEELESINGYYAGIEVSPHMLSVHEGDESPAIVTVKSTIPITCHSREEAARNTACGLTLRFRTSRKEIALRKEEGSGCTHTISEADWRTDERNAYKVNQRIELYAMIDLIMSSPRHDTLIVDFDSLPDKKTSDGTDYKNIWNKHTVPGIQVYHNDGPHAVCRATGDPNLTTFDRLFYSVYASGQFTYVQTTRGNPIEIQVRHKPCGQAVSCVCGVAAREGDIILIADRCVDPFVRSVTPNDPAKLPKGTGIKEDATGRSLEA